MGVRRVLFRRTPVSDAVIDFGACGEEWIIDNGVSICINIDLEKDDSIKCNVLWF